MQSSDSYCDISSTINTSVVQHWCTSNVIEHQSTIKNQILTVTGWTVNKEQVAPRWWIEITILSSTAPDRCQWPKWSVLTGEHNSFFYWNLIIFILKSLNKKRFIIISVSVSQQSYSTLSDCLSILSSHLIWSALTATAHESAALTNWIHRWPRAPQRMGPE